MTVLIVSDLHLCASRPAPLAQFFALLEGPARRAAALYILGDLFEYWAGDDDLDDPFNAAVAEALRACSRGTQLYLMHGNRDFLMGKRWAARCGATLLADPARIELQGAPTLLAHGDALCTDDLDYQRFRGEVRSRAWIEAFMASPLAERKARIEALRLRSEAEKRRKRPDIMDVSTAAVETLLRAHGYPRLIHGHTHRPAMHEHVVDGHRCERWVLADWYENGSYLRAGPEGIAAITLG